MIDFKSIVKVLDDYGIKATKEAKQIIKKNAYASGRLFNDLKIELTDGGDSISLDITAPSYAKFIDMGVKGAKDSSKAPRSPFKFRNKMPPSAPIDRWVVSKGIAPRNKKGQFITRKSLVFAIRRSIFEKGIKAIDFTAPYYDNLDKLFVSLEEKFGEEVANQIKSIL